MRIALSSYEYPPHIYGGIGNYTRQAALMLRRRGHEVVVFAACPDRSYSDELEGVMVHYGQCTDRWAFAPVAAEMFAREHAEEPFDVVEAPELASEGREIFRRFPEVPSVVRLHTPAYLAAWVDRAVFGKCAVFLQAVRSGLSELVRGRWPRKGVEFWRSYSSLGSSYDPADDDERRTALAANVMSAPSRKLADELTKTWLLDEGAINVVPYPHRPDKEPLSIRPPSREVQTILYYGGIKGFKGVDVLAKAIPLVLHKHPRIRFVFAGRSQGSPFTDFSLRAFLRGRVCHWQEMETWLEDNLSAFRDSVELRGLVDATGVKRLLAEADICVFPSRFDNFPNACLEAMSAGRPIVATRSGGMEEMLGPTGAGLLVAPGSVRELAEAINRMIEDADGRALMARRAREQVLRAYGDDVVGPQYEKLYRQAVRCAAGKGKLVQRANS